MRGMAFLLLLYGCASEGTQIIWHKTERPEIDCALIYRTNKTATGCYVWRQNVCHVYAPDPKITPYLNGQWGTLGHEIKHCFDGQFHE